MKKIVLFLTVLTGLFVLPLSGQTTTIKIVVVSPPSPIPACLTLDKPSDPNSYILIPDNLELIRPASITRSKDTTKVNGIVYKIFPFSSDSVKCETTDTGYEITASGSSQPNTSEGVIQPVARATPPPAPTPDPNFPTVTPKAKAKAEDNAKEVDFSIPESPGFTILGLNPQEVTRPATPREFATSIINSLDRNGNFQSGIALDTAPFQLLYPKTKRKQYIENSVKGFFTRLAWRTQFSLATVKGTTEDDKSARLGTGLNMTIFDLGDPTTDNTLAECQRKNNDFLREEAYRALGFSGSDDERVRDEDVVRATARMTTLITEKYLMNFEKCADDAAKRNFGKSSFGIGTAASWISKDGTTSKFVDNGQAIWASLAYGFEGIDSLKCSDEKIENNERCIKPQLIFHFRRRVRETVPNPLVAGMFTTKDSNLFGMRLRVGVPKWSINFEGVYRGERYAGRTSSNNIQVSFGADRKLADNFYLNFSIGGETKESNIPKTGKVFVRTAFNWGTSQKPLQ